MVWCIVVGTFLVIGRLVADYVSNLVKLKAFDVCQEFEVQECSSWNAHSVKQFLE